MKMQLESGSYARTPTAKFSHLITSKTYVFNYIQLVLKQQRELDHLCSIFMKHYEPISALQGLKSITTSAEHAD